MTDILSGCNACVYQSDSSVGEPWCAVLGQHIGSFVNLAAICRFFYLRTRGPYRPPELPARPPETHHSSAPAAGSPGVPASESHSDEGASGGAGAEPPEHLPCTTCDDECPGLDHCTIQWGRR